MQKTKKLKILNIFTAALILSSTFNSAFAQEIAKSPAKAQVLTEGTKIPEINLLKTVRGRDFDLNKAISEKPTILIFYRGGWCPYCNAQLSKLNSIEKPLKEIGFQIIAISPDKPESLKESLKKHDMTYLLLSDSKMETAKAFGIAFKVDDFTLFKYKAVGIDLKKASGEDHKLLPVPSVFIIDTKGIIKFKYSNPDYKVRVEPEIILKEAKALMGKK